VPLNGRNIASRTVTGASASANRSAGSGGAVASNGCNGGSPVAVTGGTRVAGVSINPGPGAYINGGPGVVAGSVVGVSPNTSSPVCPDYDVNAPWYRRYRQAQDAYWNGGGDYNWGCYGPVFVVPSENYYVGQVDQMFLTPGPVFANEMQQVFNQGPVVANAAQADQAKAAAAQPQAEADQGPDQVVERKRTVAKLTPEKLNELMTEGTQLFLAGKYNESAAKFLRVTLADRQNVDATLAYAIARFATGDYQIAGLAVRRGIRRIPEVVNSAFDVRSRYSKPDHFRNHLTRLEHYLTEHPADLDAWVVLGFVKYFSGERAHAVEVFRRLRDMPRADVELAEIFLGASPEDGQDANPPATETQPAAVQERPAEQPAPFLLPGETEADRSTVPLISIDAVE
jgi:tetratricopeptide (TPR) repeat protein